MTRQEKQFRLATAAIGVRNTITNAPKGSGKAFFGSQGVTLFKNGESGDIIGRIILLAGLVPNNLKEDVEDPKQALAMVLGVDVVNLPEDLQKLVNELAVVSDDTKRSYERRVPKLSKLLDDFADMMPNAKITATQNYPTQIRFVAQGKTL